MTIESLINPNTINIKGLQLDSVERSRGSEAWNLFCELKQTPLYDAEKKRWNHLMTEDQELVSSRCFAQNQLLGILIEGFSDKQQAREQYEELKRTPLYDHENNQWNNFMTGDLSNVGYERFAFYQLFDVLVEGIFDKDKAKEKYEALKKTKFYDADRDQWNQRINKNQELNDSDREASDQLLGVIIDAMFEPEKAEQKYTQLKKTMLYSDVDKLWGGYLSEYQVWGDNDRSDPLFLGILTESLFDKEEAKNQFNSLKQTNLYDPNKKQWNYDIVSTDRHTLQQLLAVWVEYALEEKQPEFKEMQDPLPTVRRF